MLRGPRWSTKRTGVRPCELKTLCVAMLCGSYGGGAWAREEGDARFRFRSHPQDIATAIDGDRLFERNPRGGDLARVVYQTTVDVGPNPALHFPVSLSTRLSGEMSTMLENFVFAHPTVTLSHTDYGKHFRLGAGVNILSAPTQRVQSFVEQDGAMYRFLVVGQLTSFKVVEDAVGSSHCHPSRSCSLILSCSQFGHFLSVNLGEPALPSRFAEVFQRQHATLHRIEDADGENSNVHDQVPFVLPKAR